jgi:hypothetical protein
MAKFDFNHARQEIAEINSIVETCPDAVKEKCFELLFAAVFGTRAPPAAAKAAEPQTSKDDKEKTGAGAGDHPAGQNHRKVLPNVLALARRNNITLGELAKLFILDHEPLLPVYKIPTGNTARGQMYKVMMVLLENGLLNNTLSAPYAELRENLKDDGLFDGNFNKLLKRNHALFKGAVTEDAIKEGENIELTGAGQERLAEIIKELAQL